MKSIVIAAVVAIGMAAAGTASAQEALAKSSGCMNCHDVATKKTRAGIQGDRRQVQGQGRCRGHARDDVLRRPRATRK